MGDREGDLGAIGMYVLVDRIAIGKTSEVLLAEVRDPFGQPRRVVIKRLLARGVTGGGGGSAERQLDERRRPFSRAHALANEAAAYARLVHPSIVRLYDVVDADGEIAIVLEHVDGISLSRLRALLRGKGRALDDAAALLISYRVFEALAAAHAAPGGAVVHRDVSPSNVLVGWDAQVKLADFGLAKLQDVHGAYVNETRAGLIKGTYGYMAPEQVVGEPVTERTDVYAACLLLRELLLKTTTFPRGELPELEFLRAMAEPRLAPIEKLRRGVTPALARALARGLEPDPSKRDLSAAEMVAVMSSALDVRRAQAVLASALERVRSDVDEPASHVRRARIAEAARDSAPTLVVPTPAALAFKVRPWIPPAPTIPPVASTLRPPPPRRSPARALAVVLTCIIAGVGAASAIRAALETHALQASARSVADSIVAALPTMPSTDLPTTRSTEIASATPMAPTSVTPAPSATPIPTSALAATSTGLLHTSSTCAGHRVYFDGAAIGGCGASLRVRCGMHTIRLASTGRAQRIDVPCGGFVLVRE